LVEHRNPLALLDCGGADEKRDHHPLGVLESGGEVDHDFG